MRALRRSAAAWLVALLLGASTLGAQPAQDSPHAGYVYPAGGQAGTTFDVAVGGRFLEGVTRVIVSGPGIRASVVGYDRPLTPQQIDDLREKLQALQKSGNVAAFRQQAAETRAKILDSRRRNANPTLAEIVTLRVTIAPDADPGPRQLRVETPLGLSNPIVFVPGRLPEFREKDEKIGQASDEQEITLPAVVNGRIVPRSDDGPQLPPRQALQALSGDVDRYRFAARKGQDLVIAVSARNLMPYLADAVPGWFQATLTLFGPDGREAAYEDDYRSEPDPVLHYQVPADGEYTLEIKDALSRGREDFVYRIAIGELPFVTSIFPLGGREGTRTNVEVRGWNLPSSATAMDARRVEPGIYPLVVSSGRTAFNAVPFAVDTLPEAFEHEPNDSQKEAQQLTLPVIVNGRIQQPGDWDTFSFGGRAGDQIVAEVYARRLGSPLDSVLELTDAAGRRIALNDDHDDKAFGLIAHQADSLVTATLPASGAYFLRLGDVQHKGGPEYAYRLRVGPPRPDFELRLAPSAINARGNGSVPLTVYALRRDGFDGDIALELKGAPGGFALSGGLVPAGQDQVRVTLTAPASATSEPISLRVEGRAKVQGRTVVHQAVPADELMQAFAYHHLVPADDLRVSVAARGATRVPPSILSPQPVRIPAQGTVRIRVALPPGYLRLDKIEFELADPPEGLTLRDSSLGRTGAELVLQADGAKVKPGLRGNLIVNVSGERAATGNQQAQPARRRLPLGTLPAIAFEIVQPR